MTKYASHIIRISLAVFAAACSTPQQSSLPVIKIYENINQTIILHGQPENYLVINSHRQNSRSSEGWFVGATHLLMDYRIYLEDKYLSLDSLDHCELTPATFTRWYIDGVVETISVPDSLDAVIWTISGEQINRNLRFEPAFLQSEGSSHTPLSSANNRLVISLPNSDSADKPDNQTFLGFQYSENASNAVTIIALWRKNRELVNQSLDLLADNYSAMLQKKQEKITAALDLNITFTNVPEITDALSWAQFSMDAQISALHFPVIRPGLQDFQHFPARDVFRSLPGALLVSGQFSKARRILETFGAQQYPPDDKNFPGQIPDLDSGQKPSGASADASWWYIRTAYEYICYSGDTQFIRTVFPVIQKALEGTIHSQMDSHFYYTPVNKQAMATARRFTVEGFRQGDRIVELQVLWYTALHIGANLAEWSEQGELADYWRAIASTLSENFYRDFWNSFSYKLYDHVKKDGRIGKNLNPEHVFAVTVPDLPGIEPLLSEEIRARITSSVLSTLAYYDGVRPGPYQNPETNQTAPSWLTATELSNPLISSLIDAAQDQPAYTLFYNAALQILFESPLGGWTEFHTRSNSNDLNQTGKINNAVSLAGFLANFYQNFTGYRPNLADKEIYLRPLFPQDLRFIATRLPHPDGGIQFTYTLDDNLIRLELTRLTESVNCNIIVQIPGYEAVEISLNREMPTARLTFLLSDRRSYQKYPALDWYFTQTEDSIQF